MAATQSRANGTVQPNQSLYLQNLPEKLQKGDLRRALYMLFSTYGPVLDITALKTGRMRGQAHVLFRDVQAASQAMAQCQSFEFFGREMKISYAKNRSDTLSKLTGTYKQAAPQQAPGQQQPQQQLTAAGSLQESVFAAPPGVAASLAAAPTQPPPGIANTQAPPQGLPQKLANGETGANGVERAASPGEKRKRGDEGEDEAGDAPRKRDAVDAGGAVGDAEMEEEEDDDDGGEMELDSDDD